VKANFRLFLSLIVVGLFTLVSAGNAISHPLNSNQASTGNEVWVLDQGNVGEGNSGQLHIYTSIPDGKLQHDVMIDLGLAAQAVSDGAGSMPHMINFNRAGSDAVISNMGSGHVYIMHTSDHQIVASIDVGNVAHHALPSWDDQVIVVAKENEKKLGLIRTDYVFDMYSYDSSEDLDLAAYENIYNPDNAPSCPLLVGRKAYVSLRGGGLYIVDTASKPMHIIKAFSKSEIAPAGCGGVYANGRVYITAGANLYVIDAKTDELLLCKDISHWGMMAHGVVKIGLGKYLWIAMQGAEDRIIVFDTVNQVIVSEIDEIGAASGMLSVSSDGQWVYATLQGPNSMTGTHNGQGETPGVDVIQVLDDGAYGQFWGFYNVGALSTDSPNDPHGIAVLKKSW
jgi:DNA-binding beta-propeller fold protein YncE